MHVERSNLALINERDVLNGNVFPSQNILGENSKQTSQSDCDRCENLGRAEIINLGV
jgi:hypothetical protein